MTAPALALLAGALLLWPRQSRAALRLADLTRRGRLPAAGAPAGPSRHLGAGSWLSSRITARSRAVARDGDALRAMRLLMQELRGGADPAQAWAGAAAVGGDAADWIGRVARGAALGEPVGALLHAEAAAVAPPAHTGLSLVRLGAAWSCGVGAGASMADVLEQWVADAQARQHADSGVASELAGPRASALLLAGLPVLGLAMGTAMGADPVRTLVGTGAGRALLVLGLALEVVGVLWVRRIVRMALRA